jgi:ubiquinone/menaquinone biosynthesis C-methylase UbiE
VTVAAGGGSPRPQSLRASVAGGSKSQIPSSKEAANSKIQTFKDHFSKQAAEYAKFRPRYPQELFRWLASVAPGNELAWDCATGSGQAAVELAAVFGRVIATDASEKQVANAEQHPRVEYRVAAAENSGIESGSVDLITVAQALHWFDLEKFYPEVRRVLKSRGIVAVWAYKFATVSPAIDAIVHRYYSDVVGPYWPEERVLVEKFEELPFAFNEIGAPSFEMVAEWRIEHVLGYLRTWSATQRFMAAEGRDPIEEIEGDLRKAWDDEVRCVVWPLTVRVGRV